LRCPFSFLLVTSRASPGAAGQRSCQIRTTDRQGAAVRAAAEEAEERRVPAAPLAAEGARARVARAVSGDRAASVATAELAGREAPRGAVAPQAAAGPRVPRVPGGRAAWPVVPAARRRAGVRAPRARRARASTAPRSAIVVVVPWGPTGSAPIAQRVPRPSPPGRAQAAASRARCFRLACTAGRHATAPEGGPRAASGSAAAARPRSPRT
jgi:hypothetical protein